MKVIAHIRNDFPEKFGIPHQSGRIQELKAEIVFEPEYRNPEAFRGLEEYSHIWLIWEFSKAIRPEWSPTVRPPRLGGNIRKGVFATRSPFRPNPIGLSSVKLEGIEFPEEGPILHVKPYLAYVDSHPDASGGFTDRIKEHKLQVEFPEELLKLIPEEKREVLLAVLANDPRPGYQKDPKREYGMAFGKWDIHFKVDKDLLSVHRITVKKFDKLKYTCKKYFFFIKWRKSF